MDIFIKVLEIVGTALIAVVSMYIKDAVAKNSLKERAKQLEDGQKKLEDEIKTMKADAKKVSENQVGGLRDIYNLNKNFEEFKANYKNELSNVNKTMAEVGTSLNHLSIAVEGLKGYLEAQRDRDRQKD